MVLKVGCMIKVKMKGYTTKAFILRGNIYFQHHLLTAKNQKHQVRAVANESVSPHFFVFSLVSLFFGNTLRLRQKNRKN